MSRAKRAISAWALLLAALAVTETSFPAPAIHAFTARNLMYGSTGYDVDELQGRLHLLGYYWGRIDGVFGWKTYWAVRSFQYNFGLPVTGDVDMRTKIMLVKATPNWNYKMDFPNSSSTPSSTGAAQPATVSGSSATLISGDGFTHGMDNLSASDLNLMAHVVYGEARGEPFEGQVAVAAVILNRLHDPKFPKSIPAIVYQPGAFDCVNDGQINLQPNKEAMQAVIDAVNGWDPTHGALYYFNPAKTSNAWMWAQPELVTIGHHIFTA
ncbi:spore cortex-lytic enzyme [Alicyclobacillus mali]|uniref:Spore cortex-lytic enzyme n=1 Tax=Alicyclobacillus mali (ex Roth et al. 2021) TaxID=1123961 RepID=A0ABS0EZC3_9BACL|nr:spore cortex-lytic enzyme [Alicyclobacillus mali (ex Roth et al. 2021)]MBF8376387.1 spore cortex-lytic enzyme [Alicyclobacillus mali (ex Roth et al. 2021)]MCL6488901.1 spore cortex-lytic enzyme [Alicyclobacillus mali (ex Roth et al. 2021)]